MPTQIDAAARGNHHGVGRRGSARSDEPGRVHRHAAPLERAFQDGRRERAAEDVAVAYHEHRPERLVGGEGDERSAPPRRVQQPVGHAAEPAEELRTVHARPP